MANLNDKDLLGNFVSTEATGTIEFIDSLKDDVSKYVSKDSVDKNNLSYPLDKSTIERFKELKNAIPDDEKNLPYSKIEMLNVFWKMIIEKSIQCLRLFDTREPFKKNPDKTIVAYGIDELFKYYNSYIEFEGLLYGSNTNYRDHIFHVFRTWLIGLNVMIKHKFEITNLDGMKDDWGRYGTLTNCEKVSIWTIIAFCHDLGYPLEKSKKILHITQSMMQEIVTESKITADFSFGGTQISINEYIVKFISTKMNSQKVLEDVFEDGEKKQKEVEYYNGRIQPKYYLKLTKSLEKFNHGIISAIIIYKTLLYFLESDFNLNDDYKYAPEDARQFYIRREILRAIAAHTCPDIYNINVTTFSSLLYICDEIQNWDRKSWHELYSAQELKVSEVTIKSFSNAEISYTESITLGAKADIKKFVHDLFNNQYIKYKKKFRDGQDSAQRKFNIKDTIIIEKDIDVSDKPIVEISISIMGNNQSDKFEVKYNDYCTKEDKASHKDNDIANSVFAQEFKVI